MTDIQQRVIQVVTYVLSYDEDSIDLNDCLIYDLGADNIDITEIVMDLEDVFNINIDDNEFDDSTTVQDLINYLNKVID